jgi:CRP-like cAMP-binding protein
VAEVHEILARLALFADLSAAQLEGVAHRFEDEVYPAGSRVLRKGLGGSGLYVILEGEAAVVIDGRERALFGAGEFFGEISLLTGEPPNADIEAKTMLRCLVIPRPEFEPFVVAHPRVLLRMLQAEARRLRNAELWPR